MGTSCPDHFLRTKISPLVLNLTADEDVNDVTAIKEKLAPQFEDIQKNVCRLLQHLQTSEQSGYA